MKSVLIVGCGNIGSKFFEEIKTLNPDRYDPSKGFVEKRQILYDFAFVCVDTPMDKDGGCDLSQVESAISETNADIIVLRSTVPPLTTKNMSRSLKKEIVFMPEFYGLTQHSDENTFDFSFSVIGGDVDSRKKVVQLLQNVYDARHRFCLTDSTTAELAKYMENCALATKVSFCVQFYKIAEQFGVDYSEMREIVLNDPRFNRSHTFVYEDRPFWDSHCLNKDMLAIVRSVYAPLIQSVISFNEECKLECKLGGEK